MLRSDSLFGKREGTAGNTLNSPSTTGSPLGQSTVGRTVAPAQTAAQAESARLAAAAAAPVAAPVAPVIEQVEGGSKLIVGPNIKLKGVEITDCDTIVVEGFVEATIYSRVIQIAEQGAFKGSAEIDIAEIRGHFDGDLTVRQKLVICSTGKVSGKIRYGKLVIEEGGQISGDVQMDVPGSIRATGVPTLTEQFKPESIKH
ncbi:MAG TPA: polymer-forming cytoskeletal protein [Burkholderiaceae bacterium]|nr:polymer-forming cytoskeletal protein [Burkholderiaceae bacterium]